MSHSPEAHVFWLVGLSGAGKSTLAELLAAHLRNQGIPVLMLDGDTLRSGLNKGLGFSESDRTENLRRAAEVARLALASSLCVVSAFITPLAAQRRLVTEIVGRSQISIIWIDAPLELCRSRDVKGLYAKARQGAIPDMSGVSSPFESVTDAAMVVDSATVAPSVSASRLFELARTVLATTRTSPNTSFADSATRHA